nr:GGDEF domain-containing protein [Luteimonas cucumeris]
MTTASLTADEYALFAEFASARRVQGGERLFHRGDHGATMFVVAQGRVELDFGDDLTAKLLGPGEFFGELALLIGDHARSAGAVMSESGVLLVLQQAEFEKMVERNPRMLAQFLRRTIMRVVLNEQSLIRRLRLRNEELQNALDHLHATTHQLNKTEELVRTDDLTGLYNRRGLTLHLQESRALGMAPGLGLLLIDCDRFKQVNDEHGHLAGDRVLQSVANILRSVAGPEDMPCRLGGDEFCLLIAAEHPEKVKRYADFIISTTQGLLMLPQSPPPVCPVSVGGCLIDPASDWNAWYGLADAALYRAKRLGGNRFEWQGSDAGHD